jgi:hypothetical protein
MEQALAGVADAHKRAQQIQEQEQKARKVPPLGTELRNNFRLSEADCSEDFAAVQKFKAAHSDYGRATDDDLIAARVYSREHPAPVYKILNQACRQMIEHDEPPEHCCSTFAHLKCALTEMRGCGADEPLYRGQSHMFGDDATLDDPEDPKQYETGRIVHWRAFTSTSQDEKEARRFAGPAGVLFIIEPRDEVPNLGAILKPLSMYPGEEEILLPPGSAFQVLSYETESDGLRVITLKHAGTWVSEKLFERHPELQQKRAQELRLCIQLSAQAAHRARQSWGRAHPEVDITGERSALAVRKGGSDQWATALAGDPVDADGDSYVEFTRMHKAYPYVGVVTAGYASVEGDPVGYNPASVDDNGVHCTEHGWMYTCDHGNLYHQGNNVAWASGKGRKSEEGETVGLRLCQGSLIAYVGGARAGVLCEGLQGQFVWAADLKGSGTSVRIMGKPPPRR